MSPKVRFYLFIISAPLLAVILFVGMVSNRIQAPEASAVNIPVQKIGQDKTKPEIISGYPSRIVIPSANIDVSVVPGKFSKENNTWTLSNNAAQYATPTILPNNKKGNTFIYGHNNPHVFGGLYPDKTTRVFLHVDTGKVFEYKFSFNKITSPDDLSVFEYKGAPMLTLQTCSGIWNENRNIMWFKLVKVS